jgi:hypothetical protein
MAFGRKAVATAPGKRFLGRLRVRLPAKVVTMSKTYPAILLDVSGGGAKVEIEGDPPRGEVMLRWGKFEAHGAVCWEKAGRCGLSFDSKVPQDVLLATGDLNEAAAIPADCSLTAHAAQGWADGSGKFGFD